MPSKNKVLYAIGSVAILVVGVFIGTTFETRNATQSSEQTVVIDPVYKSEETATNRVGAESPTPPSSAPVKVTRVVDGDTIDVEIDGKTERVRYIGIDTPETVDPRKPVQCFGVEASKKNKELVEGKMVRLEKDITDRDRYGRLLRYVWVDDTLINQELVAQGFASSYSYPPDIARQDLFVVAEKKAREEKLGLWSACASGTAPITTTSSSITQSSAPNLSCTIKGNISASGEKIYHLEGCGSYMKTTIDEGRGERWFCSESDAQSAGWRKARNCP